MEIKFTKRYYRSLAKFLRKHSPTHPSLRLHKLTNREDEYAFSVDHSVRIIFHREKNTCYLLDIGSHDEVY